MQSTYDYLVDQIIDLNAYVDKMSMHEMDRDVLETYIKSIKTLAVEIRDFVDHRDNINDQLPDDHIFSTKSMMDMEQTLNNLTIRK